MFAYLLTSSILLFVFALGYYVFQLQGPTLPLRRRVLLAGIIGTFLLPLAPAPSVNFNWWQTEPPLEQIATWQQQNALAQLPQPFDLTVRQEQTMEEAIHELAVTKQPFWQDPIRLILVVYASVAILFLLRLGGGLWRLLRLHRNSLSTGDDRVRLLASAGEAFTFGGTVYLSQAVYDAPDAEVILTHERAHAAKWHTFDALLAEVLRAVFWFHPMAWWLRGQVQLNLEYLADAAVLAAGYDKRDYQLSLVAHQQGVDFRTSLLPQFAAKGIKRRIQMMAFRAGSQVRSWVVMAGLVLCSGLVFMITEGKAQAYSNYNNEPQATIPINTNILGLGNENPQEYNIYFRRLPSPTELAALRQGLAPFYNLDFYVFQDCRDSEGTYTFALGNPKETFLQVKYTPGEQTQLYQRFQIKRDGKGIQKSTAFSQQPLPEGASNGDVVFSQDGKWISISLNPGVPFSPDNLSIKPRDIVIKCQLGLTPDNEKDYNLMLKTQPDVQFEEYDYAAGYILGMIKAASAYDPTADPVIMMDQPELPTTYYLRELEVDKEMFLQQLVKSSWDLTLASRKNGPDDMILLRIDPSH